MLAGFSLDPLYRIVGWLLAFIYAFPPHILGISIIVLTIFVMLVQFPLIAKQTRSMIQMQRVQPEIKKIQQLYKDDRQKQNEELLKFYQENKINPIAGCLPILVTLPIGIAVYRTFARGMQKHLPTSGPFDRLYNDLCTPAHASKPLTVHECTTYLDHYPKGKTPPVFRFLGMNLNWSAREVQTQLSGHVIQWVPYFLLIALVVLTGWYQVRQTQARQLSQGSAPPNNQMQMVTRIMPVIFGLITYGLNAATTLYFLVSNVWRIGQQHFVLSKMYEEAAAEKEAGKKSAKASPEENGSGDDAGGSTQNPSASGAKNAPGNGSGEPKAKPSPNARRGKKKRRR